MASRIKGITIDIDGNATGLDKTLKEVNSQISSTQRELKDVRGLILPPEIEEGNVHSWHIYTPLIDIDELGFSRDDFMAKMSAKNIGTAYHYQALHLFTCFS